MYHDTQGREIEDLEGENMQRDYYEGLKHMQEWELEVIERILDNDHATDVSNDASKFYMESPSSYGNTHYHLVSKEYHGIVIDQISNERFAQITISTDEIPQLLKILLEWQFDQARAKIEVAMQEESLGEDLDNNPFIV